MAFGEMIEHIINNGTVETNFGRWTWILFGNGNIRTQVMVAYQPYNPSGDKEHTVFAQQTCSFERNGNFTSLRTLFFEHLVEQLVI